MQHQSLRRARGFTLIELLIVVVVIGVALAMALPRISAVRQGVAIDAAAQQLVGDLRRAKVEALKRNVSIKVYITGASTYRIDSIGNRQFEGGVRFNGGPATVTLRSFGPPLAATAYTLGLGSRTKTVSMNAAGLMSVK